MICKVDHRIICTWDSWIAWCEECKVMWYGNGEDKIPKERFVCLDGCLK